MLTKSPQTQADGHQALFIPENAQNRRIADYFMKAGKASGAILETQTYNPKITDFSSY
jgi:hypothetical protein